MEGLWTIEFGSSEGVYGGGVVVFSEGRIMGGDAAYYYTGSYAMADPDSFAATLHVKRFIVHVGMMTIAADGPDTLKHAMTDLEIVQPSIENLHRQSAIAKKLMATPPS